jgi:hypothetical protein
MDEPLSEGRRQLKLMELEVVEASTPRTPLGEEAGISWLTTGDQSLPPALFNAYKLTIYLLIIMSLINLIED